MLDRVLSNKTASASHTRTVHSGHNWHRSSGYTRAPQKRGILSQCRLRRPDYILGVSLARALSTEKDTLQSTDNMPSSTSAATKDQPRTDDNTEEVPAATDSTAEDIASPFLLTMQSSLEEELEGTEQPADNTGPVLASLVAIGGVALLIGAGVLFKGQIKMFLEFFVNAVDEWGPLGYVAYALVYTGLEVLAVPAIPLTMTAGAIFGPVTGTIITSISATAAAVIAFLIARYAARKQVMKFASRNRKFAAIDRAIGRDGIKFVTLLRLSPLLPLAASNYLYGLTSVDLGSYAIGSFLGMIPGTYAYVYAGFLGKEVFLEGEGSLSVAPWQIGLAATATIVALGFVGHIAKQALAEVEQENTHEKGDK